MKNKEKIRVFISGFIVAALIFGLTVGTFASSLSETIEVVYNNIKLVIDGQNIKFGKDTAGNQIEPFIYNGTTYLPVRTVGEAIGKDVDWDSKTNTIYIGNNNISEEIAYLSKLDLFNWDSTEKSALLRFYPPHNTFTDSEGKEELIKDSTGKEIINGLLYRLYYSNYPWDVDGKTKSPYVYSEYLLNQEYTKLQGNISLAYTDRFNKAEYILKVYGDDKLLYTSPIVKAGILPIGYAIDVKNITKIKFLVEQTKSSDSDTNETYILLGDLKLFY